MDGGTAPAGWAAIEQYMNGSSHQEPFAAPAALKLDKMTGLAEHVVRVIVVIVRPEALAQKTDFGERQPARSQKPPNPQPAPKPPGRISHRPQSKEDQNPLPCCRKASPDLNKQQEQY
jgi:hypothetical protein